jgi:hypothetical protein
MKNFGDFISNENRITAISKEQILYLDFIRNRD